MKNAAVVIVAAGIAGATWFNQEASQTPVTAKIQVPDPGPLDDDAGNVFDELVNRAAQWPSTDQDVVVPDDPLPSDQVAELPAQVQMISDEQIFASSEDADDAPAAAPKKTPVESAQTVAEPTSSKKPEFSEWKSVEGRPITIRRMGEGRFRTVLLTGLDGRDRAAVHWADELAHALEQRVDLLQQQEIIIVRVANPDGLATKSQKNSHGVVLNRNFPTKRYRLDSAGAAGAGPASEPETRAVLQTLYDVRPQRVIHLSSTMGNSGAYHNTSGEEVAERLQRQFGLRAEPLDLNLVPGSVEEFADATWRMQVLRLNVRGVADEDVPRKVLPLILSAVTSQDQPSGHAGTVAPVSTPRREQSRWQTGPTSSTIPTSTEGVTNRRSRSVNRRGYEELPPPPQ